MRLILIDDCYLKFPDEGYLLLPGEIARRRFPSSRKKDEVHYERKSSISVVNDELDKLELTKIREEEFILLTLI